MEIIHETDSTPSTTYSLPAYADIMVAYSTYDGMMHVFYIFYLYFRHTYTYTRIGMHTYTMIDERIAWMFCWRVRERTPYFTSRHVQQCSSQVRARRGQSTSLFSVARERLSSRIRVSMDVWLLNVRDNVRVLLFTLLYALVGSSFASQ